MTNLLLQDRPAGVDESLDHFLDDNSSPESFSFHLVGVRTGSGGRCLARETARGCLLTQLLVLPHTSNLSLANNGVHVSIGSTKLSRALASSASGFGPGDEKYLGDLVLKIVEHFLPLFVGTYSGAPYRLDFTDFHPERVLGFLAHELDFTHLRMLWRRWKKKARNRVLSRSLTPFGPEPLDRALKFLFSLKGDLVQDIRLLDYPVALMGTETSSALDGSPGNGRREVPEADRSRSSG